MGVSSCALTRTLLRERRRHPELFASGSYEPLAATTNHAVAFLRRSGGPSRPGRRAPPRLPAGRARTVIRSESRCGARSGCCSPRGHRCRYRDLLTGRIVQRRLGPHQARGTPGRPARRRAQRRDRLVNSCVWWWGRNQRATRPRPVTSGRSRAVTSPGAAATTAGTALTRRMAVAFSPAVLWSPSVPISCRSSV